MYIYVYIIYILHVDIIFTMHADYAERLFRIWAFYDKQF